MYIIKENFMPMPKERAGIIFMACAGVLALGFGLWQIRNNIRAPFKLRAVDKSQLSEGALEIQKDTDGDGLLDFEEQAIYGTSPYLEDTDSDGAADGEEIRNGTDPNCPAGKQCGNTEPAAAAEDSSSDAPETPAGTGLPANLSADQIRELLRQGGMSDENLKKMDDAALLEIYNQTLKEVSGE